jgi:hypothetical protein
LQLIRIEHSGGRADLVPCGVVFGHGVGGGLVR